MKLSISPRFQASCCARKTARISEITGALLDVSSAASRIAALRTRTKAPQKYFIFSGTIKGAISTRRDTNRKRQEGEDCRAAILAAKIADLQFMSAASRNYGIGRS